MIEQSKLKHITELALIRSIPDLMVGNLKPGRLKNLMHRLQGAVDVDLGKIARSLSPHDISQVQDVLEQFEKVSSFGKQKHVGTITSFCLGFIEKSDKKFSPRIIDTLNDICEYYERAGKMHVASMWSGDLASERWESLFNIEESAPITQEAWDKL